MINGVNNDYPEYKEAHLPCHAVKMASANGEHAFRIGETFSTFSELEEKIRQFKDNAFIDLYRRDSKTIEKANVKRHIKAELRFYRIKYACVFGGRKFKSFSKGERSTS